MNYDAILIVSFGGPESRADVIPFLENVLRGRNVPRERMQVVAEHYYHFEGKSPINQQIRELITALFRRQRADPALSRGEALRQAMMALLDGPGAVDGSGRTIYSYAHPLFWAPYSVIGDGGGS